MSATVLGGPMDGETIDGDITIRVVPIAHTVDDKLAGVAWHQYEPEAGLLRFYAYQDYSWM